MYIIPIEMPVDNFRHHPDVQQPLAQWSEEETLHMAVVYENPFRWNIRRKLANDCIRHLRTCPNIALYVVELAYGDRPFEITGWHDKRTQEHVTERPRNVEVSPARYVEIQLRTNSFEFFHKENLINIGLRHVPPSAKYVGYCDADFHFTRHDFALEAIHQHVHYDVLQLFSSYVDLSGNVYGQKDLPVRYHTGFFFNYIQNGYKVSPQYHNGQVPDGTKDAEGYEGAMLMRGVGATGGAFSFRRSAYDAISGLLDRCPLGHADWYMAYGLLDIEPPDIHSQKYHPHYKHYVNTWRERAQVLKKNVGYVDCHAIHFFHGSKTRRAYSSRDTILAKHQFSPYEDVFSDFQGVYQLNPNKLDLRDDLRHYLTSRFEDDPNIYGSEKLIV